MPPMPDLPVWTSWVSLGFGVFVVSLGTVFYATVMRGFDLLRGTPEYRESLARWPLAARLEVKYAVAMRTTAMRIVNVLWGLGLIAFGVYGLTR